MRTFIALVTAAALLTAKGSAQANMLQPMTVPASHTVTVPSLLSIREQYFDATVGGLRGYLETIRSDDPELYARLDPRLSELETRQRAAVAVLVVGVGVGLVSTVYAFAGRKSCASPSVNDPNFAADMDAWGRCNDDNMRTTTTFALVGLGAVLVGGAVSAAIVPWRSDILEIVNEHNRLSREPLRWQLGYDPTHRTAIAGASLAF